MNYKIRELLNTEYGVLDDFLYEAIFVPEGGLAPPKENYAVNMYKNLDFEVAEENKEDYIMICKLC